MTEEKVLGSSLEEMIEGDIACQARHYLPILPLCSVEVTHVVTYLCGGGSFRVCTNVAERGYHMLYLGGARCMMCERPVRQCWEIRPI